MPRIIDNISLEMRTVLSEALEHSQSLDAAIGYFNLRGWRAISEAVDGLEARPAVRLLVGMQTNPAEELRNALRILRRMDGIDNATALRFREQFAQELRDQLTWGIPSKADEAALRNLRRQLLDGQIRVKLFLRHNLHAKLYVCHRSDPVNPRVGFVGSSNLTYSGLAGSGELSVDVLDHDATEKLADWFTNRWDDQFSIDITEELIEILEESWAGERLIPPYLVHLKIAYHLSRDARAGLVEYGLPASMANKLLEYQSAAVRITARNLMARNGAMLGDVVGLGKTIVATAVALVLQEEQGFETLVICPKNLVRMWESYVETYRLHARVLSLSMTASEIADLRRYRLVVIDESHNLRNPKRQDYSAIRDYITRNDPKVLLLTATPFNKSMLDVASQLGLFLDSDQDLGIRPEAAIAEMGEVEFLAKCDDKPASLKAFALSEEPADWQRLLAQYLVRRTRRFIRDNYAEDDEDGRQFLRFADGSRNYLPERVAKPLRFEVSPDDPTSDMASHDVLAAIDSLQLPRYQLAEYTADHGPKPSPEEQGILDALERARGNLLGFTRTMLLKRLSSSGAVFLLSLQRHLLRNHIYAEAVRIGGFLPIGTVDDSQVLGDTDEAITIPIEGEGATPAQPRSAADWSVLAATALQTLSDHAPKAVTWVRSELFGTELLDALEADNVIIQELLERFGSWDHRRDTKVDALAELIEKSHPDEKVLIFSEYADTAEYVAGALRERGIKQLDCATGKSDDPTMLARRFSPQSNVELGPTPPADQHLRVLVATDVLSEGQNLQDSAIVVNFDLPWAIIKLIQRAGRVDRIGQEAEQVLVYTFLPSDGVEAVLRLRARVAERLAHNATVFGSDEHFLGTPGEESLIRDLFDENAEFPDDGDDENVDYASAAYAIWHAAEEQHPDHAKAAIELPDGNYATLGAHEPGVLTYTLSEFGVDRIAMARPNGTAQRVSPLDALQQTACEPETLAMSPRADHFDLVSAAIDGPLATDESGGAGLLTGVRRRVYERVRNHLEDATGQLFSTDVDMRQAVDELHRSPLSEQAKQVLARALRERTPADLCELVVTLHEEGRLTIETEDAPDDLHIVCSMGYMEHG